MLSIQRITPLHHPSRSTCRPTRHTRRRDRRVHPTHGMEPGRARRDHPREHETRTSGDQATPSLIRLRTRILELSCQNRQHDSPHSGSPTFPLRHVARPAPDLALAPNPTGCGSSSSGAVSVSMRRVASSDGLRSPDDGAMSETTCFSSVRRGGSRRSFAPLSAAVRSTISRRATTAGPGCSCPLSLGSRLPR